MYILKLENGTRLKEAVRIRIHAAATWEPAEKGWKHSGKCFETSLNKKWGEKQIGDKEKRYFQMQVTTSTPLLKLRSRSSLNAKSGNSIQNGLQIGIVKWERKVDGEESMTQRFLPRVVRCMLERAGY